MKLSVYIVCILLLNSFSSQESYALSPAKKITDARTLLDKLRTRYAGFHSYAFSAVEMSDSDSKHAPYETSYKLHFIRDIYFKLEILHKSKGNSDRRTIIWGEPDCHQMHVTHSVQANALYRVPEKACTPVHYNINSFKHASILAVIVNLLTKKNHAILTNELPRFIFRSSKNFYVLERIIPNSRNKLIFQVWVDKDSLDIIEIIRISGQDKIRTAILDIRINEVTPKDGHSFSSGFIYKRGIKADDYRYTLPFKYRINPRYSPSGFFLFLYFSGFVLGLFLVASKLFYSPKSGTRKITYKDFYLSTLVFTILIYIPFVQMAIHDSWGLFFAFVLIYPPLIVYMLLTYGVLFLGAVTSIFIALFINTRIINKPKESSEAYTQWTNQL